MATMRDWGARASSGKRANSPGGANTEGRTTPQCECRLAGTRNMGGTGLMLYTDVGQCKHPAKYRVTEYYLSKTRDADGPPEWTAHKTKAMCSQHAFRNARRPRAIYPDWYKFPDIVPLEVEAVKHG